MPHHALTCSIPLPQGFRRKDFLALHSRDERMVSEKTTSRSVTKGIPWDGSPACLRIVLHKDAVMAKLAVDGPPRDGGTVRLEQTVRRMLGLDQPVAAFEAAYAGHPLLGGLVAANLGLCVSQTASPFEALSWAILGQLVSVRAAVAMRRKFTLAAEIKHSSGLWCFPDARAVAVMDVPALRACGLSQTKALSLQTLARSVSSGDLPLDAWLDAARAGRLDADEVRARLGAIRGIGPWTVSYALLRGFGYLDGSLHGDVAVRRNLARLLHKETVTEKETETWLTPFSPWRALVAAHLWAMQSRDGY
ncbi:MAG: 3-methyladenine DNA glycosylase 2 [Deltaproteobacteria bacterium]|nr:3-methyladenine DNA glycosylase 2 [Deltaproteobacteria bacterium]